MVRFRFKKGLRFVQQSGHRIWTLMRQTMASLLQFESESDGEIVMLSASQVYERLQNGSWTVDEASLGPAKELLYFATPKDFNSLGEKAQAQIKRKLAYIVGVRRADGKNQEIISCNPSVITKSLQLVATELGDPKPPHWATYWRWWKAYKGTQCFSKIVDGRQRNGYSTDAVQFSIFQEVVSEVFLTPQRKPGKAVIDAINDRIYRMNQGVAADQQLVPPAPATVYRWLNKLSRKIVDDARLGKAHTDRELRSVTGAVKVDDLLQRVEIDHTPVDLLVVCQKTRMVLGRPWLTLVLDRKSRMILGFYISFHAPSAYSVLYALRMAILPKDTLIAAIEGICSPWPARGIPRLIVLDNGMELHSDALEKFALEAAIEIQYCGAANPEMKGAIERMFRTLSHDLFHQMPGTVFHCVEARGDYPSEKLAAIDIKVLTHVLVKWIVDVYHCTPHRGRDMQGRTPLSVWQELEAKKSLELPAYPRQLDLIVGQVATRTVFHYGVQYDHIFYNSPILGTLHERDRRTITVQIRIYEHDISYIDVLMPGTDEYVRVPAIDADECLGINRHAHMLVMRMVRQRYGDKWTQQQLRAARAEVQKMIDDGVRANKAAKRKESAARQLQDSDSVMKLRASQALDTSFQPAQLESASDLPALAAAIVLPQFNVTAQPLDIA